MDGRTRDESSFSPEDQAWELAQIKKVAARFSGIDHEELEAELAVTLIALKRTNPRGIRNWKAYLTKALLNKASRLVQKWRSRATHEISIESLPEKAEPVQQELEFLGELSQIRRVVGAESYALLELWAESRRNQSRVARILGLHRNTIRRRLRAIRQQLNRPIENVSGREGAVPQRPAPVHLHPDERRRLSKLAQLQNRASLRARVILGLAAGRSYTQIAKALKTSAPTIARWKHRFEKQGPAGLTSRHRGRIPQEAFRARIASWLRRGGQIGQGSCRRIARELRISKSTVHRILRQRRKP